MLLDKEEDVFGVKSIYTIIIIIRYNERSDFFKNTPLPLPVRSSVILRSKNMNAENEEETGMKCGRCCPDCPIENDEDKVEKISVT
jgi:hypothetical protein